MPSACGELLAEACIGMFWPSTRLMLSERRRRSSSISRILTFSFGARLDHFARVLDVVVGKLGDVDQALDPGQDFDEGAEGDDLGHRALEHVAGAVGADHPLPRVLLGLLETEGDALAVAVDVEDFDPHRVADRDHFGGVVDVAPGKLGDVDQAVDPVEVDEGAEVDDVGDLALDDLAGLEVAEDLLADLFALLLEHRAAREDDVVAAAVELDDFALERLAHELVEVVDAADVDQRGGQEAAHAEVEDEAALDDLDDAAFDRFAGVGGDLDPAPGLLEAGALLGEDQAALGVLLGEDQGVDLLAQLDLFGRVDRLADRELVGGDDPLGLVADVDQDLVFVDPDDFAVDDVALVEGDHRRRVVGNDLAVDLSSRPPEPSTGVALGAGVRVSVADTAANDGRIAIPAAMPVRATKRGEERTPLGGATTC